MLTGLDHIGIAVQSIAAVAPVFRALGMTCEGTEDVAEQHVKVAFFRLGDLRIELLEPTSTDGPVARFLASRGPGVHHVALASGDVAADLRRLQAEGLELVDASPRSGADGKQVAFLHPNSTARVLVELCSPGRP
jgi:methylmalonyl-CoA/ethylmalonyl-CoA epimerase